MFVRSALRRHPGTAVPAIALAGLVLAAAGCGSSDDDKSSDSGSKKDTSSSGGTAAASTLNETATDFKFSPGKYEFYCPVANHKDLGMVK